MACYSSEGCSRPRREMQLTTLRIKWAPRLKDLIQLRATSGLPICGSSVISLTKLDLCRETVDSTAD
eukprot:6197657-Pleurochrysis_carterae.AAC.2